MAKKATKKATSKSSSKTSKAAKTTRRASPSQAKKAGAKVTRLAVAKLAVLKKIVAKGDWDSKAALDLDSALFDAVDKDLGAKYERLRDLPAARAGYWAAWWLEGEVNNGGFHQFFLNKGPVPAAVALEFHTKYGPKDVAKLLDAAIKKLPKGRLPADYEAMMKVLNPDDLEEDERLMKEMDKVTDKFFNRNGPDLQQERLKFAMANAGEFFA